MSKIIEYYLNKANYIAIDEDGKRIDVKIDYWNSKFKISRKNPELEEYATKLLQKKHKVNFISKLQGKEGKE